MKKLALILCAALGLAAAANAYEAAKLQPLLKVEIEQIKQILLSNSADKSERLYDLLEPNLDKRLMLHLVINPHSKQAPKEFDELFFRLLKKDLGGKIDLLNANSLELVDTKVDAKRCSATASVKYEESVQKLVFAFRKVGDECKLYDIIVLDTSLLGAYRAQFIDIIEHDGMNGLIANLKKSLNE